MENNSCHNDNNTKIFIKNVVAGTFGGMAQIFFGQPFDTIKVRLQSQNPDNKVGLSKTVKTLFKNEGIVGFYKGILSPLIGVGGCVCIQFSVNEHLKKYFLNKNNNQELDYKRIFGSGAVSGFCNGFLTSPIEHVRIRLQIQKEKNGYFKGVMDCYKKLVQKRILYRGFTYTQLRESIGLGVYFTVYEKMIRNEMKRKNCKRDEISTTSIYLKGGLSGMIYWISVYPLDVIKSRFQTDSISKPKFHSAISIIKYINSNFGISGFYKGFVATLLRAGPANGITFVVFELTKKYLEKIF